MDGCIAVQSVVGQGSTFSFAVPLEIRTSALRRAATLEATGAQHPAPALRILLVEDSADNRTIAMAYLRSTPHDIDIAENGSVAYDRFTAGRYDLVLMDRQMPVMDGLTATRAIREWEHANQRTPTPIIALTASALKGDREKFVAAGCTAYLTKPIKQDVLLDAIAQHSRGPPPAGGTGEDETIRVRADGQFSDLVPVFLQNRRDDVAALAKALRDEDFDTVARLGHGMKGAGGSYGFQAISDFGAVLEQAALMADIVALRASVEALSRYLDRVELVSN